MRRWQWTMTVCRWGGSSLTRRARTSCRKSRHGGGCVPMRRVEVRGSVTEADFMFAGQRRLGNHSGARQSETVENRKTFRQDPCRAGPRPPEPRGSSQRPTVSKRKATGGRKERVASIRYQTVFFCRRRGTALLPAVHVSEPAPRRKPVVPAVAISSADDALQVIAWYAWRRLSSCARVRSRGARPAARLERVRRPAHPAGPQGTGRPRRTPVLGPARPQRNCRERRKRTRSRGRSSPPATANRIRRPVKQGYSCLAKYCHAHENLAEIRKRSRPLLSPEKDLR